ncbi:Glutaredoxin family protein [Babesia bovis T2Bo]|uniref:Glutaredoxin family protein n=1 Tax=Babesia bovis T2Bo TaxID=484906 RepID=UPI001C348826|nr:Glutaredoxin family protein [Babesia bovis T2Bo]EDO06379.2 Glutaredoxin family protein [Babesia bovis T2Bo]
MARVSGTSLASWRRELTASIWRQPSLRGSCVDNLYVFNDYMFHNCLICKILSRGIVTTSRRTTVLSNELRHIKPKKRLYSTSTVEEQVETKLRGLIKREPILLLLKGTPESPKCGFSSAVVNILNMYKVPNYAYVDVLSHDHLRTCAKKVSNWPTFPQLFVNGNLVGGCDVVQQLHESGALAEILCGTKNEGR